MQDGHSCPSSNPTRQGRAGVPILQRKVSMKLQGKTALITGGATGIGYGIAKALAAEGCRVAISGRREEVLKSAAAEWSGQPAMIYRACDVGDRAAVNALFGWATKQLDHIDILVN